jgi:Pyridine nucleotide-disulphide oxidoreductase
LIRNESDATVAVVGAGPYGVSIAAHLRASGVDFRIFGKPLIRWRRHMPRGMFLKSEGFASNLSDPAGSSTLARYCSQKDLPYGHKGRPVPLETFTGYAMEFCQQLVPNVEDTLVERIEPESGGFRLWLAGAGSFRARNVVLAAGLEHAAHVPRELAGLPAGVMTHASSHYDLISFRNTETVVIGGGQSALETAALLVEQGASVRLLVRAPSLRWNARPKSGPRPLHERLRSPSSGLGAGLQLWTYANAPRLFRYLPRGVRFNRLRRVLGPAGAWWLKDRVEGRMGILPEHVVTKAAVQGSRVVLEGRGADGLAFRLSADHVIAATGYRFAVDRLPFLSPELKASVKTEYGAPVLSPYFESSVPGLYFTGLASAASFGPAMRFLEGADYTARRLARQLSRGRMRQAIPSDLELAHAKF